MSVTLPTIVPSIRKSRALISIQMKIWDMHADIEEDWYVDARWGKFPPTLHEFYST